VLSDRIKSLLMTALFAGLAALFVWMAFSPRWGDKAFGVLGALLCGAISAAFLEGLVRNDRWPAHRRRRRLPRALTGPGRDLILAAALLVTLERPFKLTFAVPLFVAWLMLPLAGRKPRLRRWGAIASGAIGIAQAASFGMWLGLAMVEAETWQRALLPAVLLTAVWWLDLRLVRAVRKALAVRPASAPA
jgi:hypothetical protein